MALYVYKCFASILMLPSWEDKCNYTYLKRSFDLALEGVCYLLLRHKVSPNLYTGNLKNNIEKYCYSRVTNMQIYRFTRFGNLYASQVANLFDPPHLLRSNYTLTPQAAPKKKNDIFSTRPPIFISPLILLPFSRTPHPRL